jgi:hypothetical protein
LGYWVGEAGYVPADLGDRCDEAQSKDVAGEDVFRFDTEMPEDCLGLNMFAPIDAEVGKNCPIS